MAPRIAAGEPRFVLLTARGTSDNAALYAKYLLEIRLGPPRGLASMSTTTAYGARPDLRDVLVVTVSQSGGSPDLVASTKAAREAGAVTLAVTNNPDSALAAVSAYHIDILAGPEKVLPATKTYPASLLSLYLFVEGLGGGDGTAAAAALPDLAGAVLGRRAEVKALAPRYRFAERMVITSRPGEDHGDPPAASAVPGNTRGPRRRDGTLSPPGTAARRYLAGGVRCLRPQEAPAQSGQRAPGASVHSPVRGERRSW